MISNIERCKNTVLGKKKTLWLFSEGKLVAHFVGELNPYNFSVEFPGSSDSGLDDGLFRVVGKKYHGRQLLVNVVSPYLLWTVREGSSAMPNDLPCVIVEYEKEADLPHLMCRMSTLKEFEPWRSDDPKIAALCPKFGWQTYRATWLGERLMQGEVIPPLNISGDAHPELNGSPDKEDAATPSPSGHPKVSICGIGLPPLKSLVQVREDDDGNSVVNIGCGMLILAGMALAAIAFLGIFLKIVF